MVHITSDMMNDYGYINAEGIQKFLEHIKSWLAKHEVQGKPFSRWLAEICEKHDYEPIFWLAFMQKEQSLTEAYTTPPQKRIDWALGYGCPETGGRNPSYKGFDVQFEAAMVQFKRYENWQQVRDYKTYRVRVFDSEDYLKKHNLPRMTVAESLEDAKNFLYNPRWEGITNLAAIWERYYKICKDLDIVSD